VERGRAHAVVLALDVEVLPVLVFDAASQACLHKGNKLVRVREVSERQDVVAAAGEEVIYGLDQRGEPLPDTLAVA
jgi:hypothetical protein